MHICTFETIAIIVEEQNYNKIVEIDLKCTFLMKEIPCWLLKYLSLYQKAL